MPDLSALYGLHRDHLADMPRAELDQYLWAAPRIQRALQHRGA